MAGEIIAAVGRGLRPAKREIDARGKLVLPAGVDSHCPIEQLSVADIMNADTFESATASVAFGHEAARLTGRLVANMDPEQNFGAKLL